MVGICSNRGGRSRQRKDETAMNLGVEIGIVEVSLYVRRCEGWSDANLFCFAAIGTCTSTYILMCETGE